MRVRIMAVEFDALSMEEALLQALGYLERGEKCRIVTPNAEIAHSCRADARLRAVVNGSQLVLPDGIGVILASRILKKPIAARLPGVEFAEKLCERLTGSGRQIFLYGGKPGVAETAAARLTEKYPGLAVCGTCDGYAREADAAARIAAARADVLLVGTGSPKQEYFIAEHLEALPVGVAVGVGGSLDIYAGALKRAPLAYQRLGLEWFYRLIREPRRIKRMAKLPMYVLDAVFCAIKGEHRDA